jgi:cytochrome c6
MTWLRIFRRMQPPLRPSRGVMALGRSLAMLIALVSLLLPAAPTAAMPAAGRAVAADLATGAPPVAAATPAQAPAVGPEAGEAAPEAADLQAGARLFEAHCVGCHIGGGNVIRRGRTLKQAALERSGLASPEAIARIAAGGIGQMSGYGAVLGEEGARQVGDWVWLQARAGWPRTPRLEPLP